MDKLVLPSIGDNLREQESSRKKKAYQDLLSLAGSISGGPKDVSIKHDKCLGEWIYDHKVRGVGFDPHFEKLGVKQVPQQKSFPGTVA